MNPEHARNTTAPVRPVRLLEMVRLDGGGGCTMLHNTAYLVHLEPATDPAGSRQ